MSTFSRFLLILFVFFPFILSANDPCSAIAIPNNGVLFTTYNLSSQAGSGVNAPPCGTYNDPDIWFSFVAPAGGSVTIEVKGITAMDPAMAIYTGACGSPDIIGCYDDQQCGNIANPGVSLTDLTPGVTYYIRVWNEVPGGGTFKLRILNLNQSNFNNQFGAYNTGPNCVQLTNATMGQRGCSWYNAPIDFEEAFELEFNLFFGNNDAGADGICLVFSTAQACGATGGGIGAEGIPNSVIIEFDTWDNGSGGYDDIPDDHTSIHVNGNFASSVAGPVALPNIEDGVSHPAHIFWDPATMTFTVHLDGAPVLTLAGYDVINNCFNGQTEIFWGWTASTGAAFNEQSFCFESANIDNTAAINEVINVQLCNGESYTSPNGNTFTAEGTYTEEFVASNGCNSVRTINLEVYPVELKFLSKIICGDEAFVYNGNAYTNAGQYTINVDGIPCDTTVQLDLSKIDFDISVYKINDLDCINNTAEINANITDLSSQPYSGFIEYIWTTDEGNIISGQGTDQIVVDKAGTYRLSINTPDAQITCSFTSDYIEVLDNSAPPVAIISPQGELDCTTTSIVLDGSASNPGPLQFTWSTSNGNIVGGNIGNTVVIDKPGDYMLIVENFQTGCKDTTTHTVVNNAFNASAQLSKVNDLDCRMILSELIANITGGDDLNIAWSTTNGHIVSDPSEDTITIDQPGIYTFTLSDGTGCSQSYSITVNENITAPVISAGVDTLITCTHPSIELMGAISLPAADFTHQWTGVGHTVPDGDNISITVDEPGIYILTVVDTVNHCVSSDSVIVIESTQPPLLDPGDHGKITCNDLTVDLKVSVADYDDNFIFNWSSNNPDFNGNVNDSTITVSDTGIYRLVVTNTVNGCVSSHSFVVVGSPDQPSADAGPDQILDCVATHLTHNGSYSTNDDPSVIKLAWSTPDGLILGPSDQSQVDLGAAGIYIFTVQNLSNGCSDTDTIVVLPNTDKPVLTVPGLYVITCKDPFQAIVPQWSNAGADPLVWWSTSDGNILSDAQDSIVNVDLPGTYTITVTNPDNGCLSSFSAVVGENTDPPQGNLPDADPLTCVRISTRIGFDPVSPDYIYAWTTMDGNITSAPDQASIIVDRGGLYSVLVTDPINGCSETFVREVEENISLPVVDAGPQGILNCKTKALTLAGTADNVTDYTVSWSGINGGHIVSGGASLTPVIDAPGQYILSVVNNENSCQQKDTVNVESRVTDPAFDGPEVFQANCFGKNGSISFETITGGDAPFAFTINGKPVSPGNLLFNGLDAGSYLIEGEDANGCSFSFSGIIDPGAGISFILPDTVEVEFGQTYQIIPEFLFDTLGISFQAWQGADYLDCNPCLYPIISPTYDANLSLTVSDVDGCPAEESLYVRVFKQSSHIFVPNVFSPGDFNGINDHVTVFADESVVTTVSEFRIFDRWGAEVFARKDFRPNDEQAGWNGYYRGKLCNPAVFVYFAKCKNIYGEQILVKGSITLVQ